MRYHNADEIFLGDRATRQPVNQRRNLYPVESVPRHMQMAYALVKNAYESLGKCTRERLAAIRWFLYDPRPEREFGSFLWAAAVMELDADQFRRRIVDLLKRKRITYTRDTCTKAHELEFLELWPKERMKYCTAGECDAPRAFQCARCTRHCDRHDHSRAIALERILPKTCFEDGCETARQGYYTRCLEHQRERWKANVGRYRTRKADAA